MKGEIPERIQKRSRGGARSPSCVDPAATLHVQRHTSKSMPKRTGRHITAAALITFLLLVFNGVGRSESATLIRCYQNAPTPVRHAVHRLSQFTGIELGEPAGAVRFIRIELSATPNPKLGAQGYSIRSSSGGDITIRGNEAEGAANGVYTFLRTLMIEHRKNPFTRKWEIEERPQFSIRAMQVAPYRFGASYGFAALSPDRWSLDEWKEYVDLMRLCNMTTLCLVPARVYHPDYPHSWREKWRFEVWKQVMDYCHQVGMKFNWMMGPNMVTEQCFWENPDKRSVTDNAWWGSALIWNKSKDLILENNRPTLEHFRGLDALELLASDGGAYFDEPDPAAYFADAVKSYTRLMREVGNDAGFVYWNWLLDFWCKVATPEPLLQKNPKFRTIQDDVIPLLPKNVAWLDASMLTLIHNWEKAVKFRGNPPMREGLLIGKENGFRPVIDFFWYMNPEGSINMFPHPYIRRAIQEAQYARDEVGVDGVMGYRLAPPLRFIDDYVYFRVSSDPSLTQEQLVNELAGLLCEKPESQRQVKEGVNTLEQFWSTRKLEDLERAEKLFRELLPQEKSKNLEYVSNGVTFLTYIVRMAQPGVTPEQKVKLKTQLYQAVKPMYIFQGLTADIVWVPEAVRFFSARVDMMVEDYTSGLDLYVPKTEVIDRNIYPKATSQPFALQWPKSGGDVKIQSPNVPGVNEPER